MIEANHLEALVSLFVLIAVASALALVSLGGGFYEFLVVDPAWPRRPDLIQPARGGVSRRRFWIPAHVAFELTLIASLVQGNEKSGGQLLLKAVTVWGTNVIAFGLWYWGFDRGGPVRRLQPNPPPPDFQFPQMENPRLAQPGWYPHLIDYIYVSFTNSIAFSPTDAMPLTRRAKLLMLSESAISSITILLVAARSVNIFK